MPKATGRPQSRRRGSVDHRTVSFSLPEVVIKALSSAAMRRDDLNKSAELTEILSEWYEIPLDVRGGEQPEKQKAPA